MIYKMSKKDAIKVSGSSRGSQIKFCKDGYWYKIDESGPEGMAEHLVTDILKHSSLSPDEYVKYEACDIEYEGKTYKGCRSKDFLGKNEQLISYSKIYELMTGKDLNEDIIPLNDPKGRIDFVCDVIKEFSGLDVHEHIAKILTIDMITLNTDRHFNNFGIITDLNYENARNAPIFDNGAAFLSNYTRNPPDLEVENIDVHSNIFGRPFSSDLEYQAVSAGLSVKFDFNAIKKEIEKYPDIMGERIRKILIKQIKTYEHTPSLIVKEVKLPVQEKSTKSYTFIMASGIPGAGKTDACKNKIQELESIGIKQVDINTVFSMTAPIAKAILNKNIEELKNEVKSSFTDPGPDKLLYISSSHTREELKQFGVYDDNITFALINVRMETALSHGISVVYDAMNLDNSTREMYNELTSEYVSKPPELIICHSSTEKAAQNHPGMRKDVIELMKERFDTANMELDYSKWLVTEIGEKITKDKDKTLDTRHIR